MSHIFGDNKNEGELSLFFQENVIESVKKRYCSESEFISNLYLLNLDNHYLLCSKVVAKIINVTTISEGSFTEKGTVLCELYFLGMAYTIIMENDGYVIKKYVKTQFIIEYNSPIFLFEFV